MHTVPETNKNMILIHVCQGGTSALSPSITQEKQFMTSKGLSSPAINSSTEYLSPVEYFNYYFILRNYQQQFMEGLGNWLLAERVAP